ncbi:hypothetical protein Pcinc_021925, partial [Petrolisthes cinctipes]
SSCCGYTEGSAGCRFQGNRCRCPFIIVPTRLSPFSELHHRRPSKPVVLPPNYVYGRPIEAAASSSSPSSGTFSQLDDETRTHHRRLPTSGVAPNYVYGRPPSSDPSDHDHNKNTMTNDDDEAPELRRTVDGDDYDHQKAPKRDDNRSDDRQTTRGDGDGEWSQGDD